MIIRRMLLALFIISITGCVTSPSVSQPYQATSSVIENGTTVQPSLSPTDYPWSTPTSPPLFVQWAKESKQWLMGNPCFAPCWSGITLAQTRVGEAISLLKNNPLVDPQSVQITRDLCGSKNGVEVLNSRRIIWRWSISPKYDPEDGAIYYAQQKPPTAQKCGVDFMYADAVVQDSTTNNGIVSRIILNFPGPTQENENYFLLPTLGEIMKVYGEPDYIVAVEEPAFSWYSLSIIYKQKGFIIRKEARNSFSLDKDTYFDELIFSEDPIKDGLARFDAKLMNTWKGLKSFDYYCHLEDGQSCK